MCQASCLQLTITVRNGPNSSLQRSKIEVSGQKGTAPTTTLTVALSNCLYRPLLFMQSIGLSPVVDCITQSAVRVFKVVLTHFSYHSIHRQ